jgi:hypothetical protein
LLLQQTKTFALLQVPKGHPSDAAAQTGSFLNDLARGLVAVMKVLKCLCIKSAAICSVGSLLCNFDLVCVL